jgi:cytochrome b
LPVPAQSPTVPVPEKENAMSLPLKRVKVWDPWIRLVHWSVLGLLGLSWWTAETGRMDLHLISGYLILTLLLFRLAWGFLGSETARFRHFLRSPFTALRHLGGMFRHSPDTQIGHNAAGGWMVLALLGLLLLQTLSGLLSDDQIFTSGPLARHAPGALVDWASWIHIRNFNLILAAAALHVVVVLLYQLLRRHDLLRPMLSGSKRMPQPAPVLRFAPNWLAALLLAISGGIVWGLSRLG